MPLFIDGNISSVDDLRAYDSGILNVASVEAVDLGAKLRLAESEIGVDLIEFLSKQCGNRQTLGSAAHTLEHVVVTPALKQWHTLLALMLIYSDIQGNHMNSRYEPKWKDYRRRSKYAADTLFRSGIGLTPAPVQRAKGASVRTEPGPLPVATYYVSIAWLGSGGDSGAPSEAVIYTPETTGVPAVKAGEAPSSVTGYDVYVGTDLEGMRKQNGQPVAPGAEWVMPPTGLIDGAEMPTGQRPVWRLRNERVLQRG